MRTVEEVLLEIKEDEKNKGLYNFRVKGVSVWRLVRFPIRHHKIKEETGATNRTTKPKIIFKEIIYNFIKSFFQFLVIVLKRKKYKYLILAFPRLSRHKNQYLDKFTDPLISLSNLKDNSLVYQRNLGGKQLEPRFNGGADYRTSDFIEYISKFFGLIMIPFVWLIYHTNLVNLAKEASTIFSLSRRFKLIVSYKIGEFIIHCFFAKLLLKATRVKQIFLVDRIIFLPYICVAKSLGIEVLELQHGITHSETILYTGDYQQEIDPDVFLNFGVHWIGNQFSIPTNKQFNIGWAYNDWFLGNSKIEGVKKSVLVISSPAITSKILKTTIELAKEYKDYSFSIRLHPQEKMTAEQTKQVLNYSNISIDDIKIDSLLSVLKHEFVIGGNSSVIYEALSLGKRVAKIMFNGLLTKNVLDDKFDGINFVYSKIDFLAFVTKVPEENVIISGIYDIFDVEKFNKLLK